MSRTRNTDPWMVRARRAEGRPIEPDWRNKWHWRNSPRTNDIAEYQRWWNDRPDAPGGYRWRGYYSPRYSSSEDRTIAQRRLRAIERNCIAREEYDMIPPIPKIKGWEDWAW